MSPGFVVLCDYGKEVEAATEARGILAHLIQAHTYQLLLSYPLMENSKAPATPIMFPTPPPSRRLVSVAAILHAKNGPLCTSKVTKSRSEWAPQPSQAAHTP